MPRPTSIPLPDGTQLPILHEDRSVLAVDKPAGWMLGPETEETAARNLHLALMAGIHNHAWWARSRQLRFVRFVHRLDAPTSGILLLVKSRGAIGPYSRLFAERRVQKVYLAITDGIPPRSEWTCRAKLGPDPGRWGRHRIEDHQGKTAETGFKLLSTGSHTALVAAYPYSGRTHQIRLHLLAAGMPVLGDGLYGKPSSSGLALRAVYLQYPDPFTRREIRIEAPMKAFCQQHHFAAPDPKILLEPLRAGMFQDWDRTGNRRGA